MDFAALVCIELSPDRYVARFRFRNGEGTAFGYLPHVPGLNPYLLQEGDEVEACVLMYGGRLEVIAVRGQGERLSDPHDPAPERVL